MSIVSDVRGALQIFDQRLDNLDSTINQLESTWQQLIDAGYLSDEDTGKRQVCAAAAAAAAAAAHATDLFSHGSNSHSRYHHWPAVLGDKWWQCMTRAVLLIVLEVHIVYVGKEVSKYVSKVSK